MMNLKMILIIWILRISFRFHEMTSYFTRPRAVMLHIKNNTYFSISMYDFGREIKNICRARCIILRRETSLPLWLHVISNWFKH